MMTWGRTIAVICGLFLAACGQTPPKTVIVTPELTETSTPVDTATPQVFVTTIVITQELPTATPGFVGTPLQDGLFMQTDLADCQLPCWQGLVVGESTKDDVQEVFNRIFRLDVPLDFFDESLWPENSIMATNDEIFGVEAGGYEWFGTSADIGYVALVDQDTHVLKGLSVGSGSDTYSWLPRTLQDVIQTLGTPDAIYVSRLNFSTENDEILMIYDEGFMTFTGYKTQILTNESETNRVKQICLDARTRFAFDYIIEPFTLEEGENPIPKNPINDAWERSTVDYSVSLEAAFGLSLEEFAAYAFEEDPCFEIDESLFESP